MKYRHLFGLFAVLSILLVVLAACGNNTNTTPSGSQEVQVTLNANTITSSVTTFAPGTVYHFVVTNKGQNAQEFAIMPMGTDMEHMSMNDIHKVALHMLDDIAPGMTMTFDYSFAQSMMRQNFEFGCNSPEQNTGWMKLPITVNQ
ncbi:MAG TPA: hypothetical protein VNE38_06670 [Ktedonobacteraceae bacterium]|nr:hypothetical protein [Ktedonobacteraceae bacterium]